MPCFFKVRRGAPPLIMAWAFCGLLALAGCGPGGPFGRDFGKDLFSQDPLAGLPDPLTQSSLSQSQSRGLFRQAIKQKIFRFTINGKADMNLPFAEGQEGSHLIKAENFDSAAYPEGTRFFIDIPALRRFPGMKWSPDENGLSGVLTWSPSHTFNKAREVREIAAPIMLQALPPAQSGQPAQVMERRASITVKKTLQPPSIYKIKFGHYVYQKLENGKFYLIPGEIDLIKGFGPVYFEAQSYPEKKHEPVSRGFSAYPKLARKSPYSQIMAELDRSLLQRLGQPRFRQKREPSCQNPGPAAGGDPSCFELITEDEAAKLKISSATAVFERRCFLKGRGMELYKKHAGPACRHKDSKDSFFKKRIGESSVSFCFRQIPEPEAAEGFLTDNVFVRSADSAAPGAAEFKQIPLSRMTCAYQAIPLHLLLELGGLSPSETYHFPLVHGQKDLLQVYVRDSNYSPQGPELRRQETSLSPVKFSSLGAFPVTEHGGAGKWQISYWASPIEAADGAMALEKLIFGDFSSLSVDFHVVSSGLLSQPLRAVFNIFPKPEEEIQHVFDRDQIKFSQSASIGEAGTAVTGAELSLAGQTLISYMFPRNSFQGFLKNASLKTGFRPGPQAKELSDLIKTAITPELSSAANPHVNICDAKSLKDHPGPLKNSSCSCFAAKEEKAAGAAAPQPSAEKPAPDRQALSDSAGAGGPPASSQAAYYDFGWPLPEDAEASPAGGGGGNAEARGERDILKAACHFHLDFKASGSGSGMAAYRHGISSLSGVFLDMDMLHNETIALDKAEILIKKLPQPAAGQFIKAGGRTERFRASESVYSASAFRVFYNLSPEIYCAAGAEGGKKDCVIYYPLSHAKREKPSPPLEKWISPIMKCKRPSDGESRGEDFECPCESSVQFHPEGLSLTDTVFLEKPGLAVRCSFDKGDKSRIFARLKTSEPNIFFINSIEEKRPSDIHQTREKTMIAPEALPES